MKALPESCLNCGTTISPDASFCSNCGQRNRQSKLPIKVFLGDFFRDYIALDSKIFRSIGKLIFRPGSLTREFNLGRRKKYVPPLRMYIFISFIYFFVLAFSQKGNYSSDDLVLIDTPADSTRMASVHQLFDSLNALPNQTPKEQKLIASLEEKIQNMKLNSSVVGDAEVEFTDEESGDIETYLEHQIERINSDPERFVQSSFRATSVAMFAMLPFFGLILFVFNYRRSKYYVEHLVHSVHFHTFIFIVFLFGTLANMFTGWDGYEWLFFIGLIYLFLSLRIVYSQSYLKAFIKSTLVLLTYSVFLTITAIIVLIAAVFIA